MGNIRGKRGDLHTLLEESGAGGNKRRKSE